MHESEKKVKSLNRVQLLATPWTAAHQAPPSMGFSRQEYWSGVPFLLQFMEADILKTSHIFSYRKILVHWPNICKEFKVFQFPVVLCLKVQGSRDPCVGAAPVTELGSSLRKMEFFVFNLSWLTVLQIAITSILACSCQVGLCWICKANIVLSPLCSDGNFNCHTGPVYFSYSLYKSLWNEDGGNPEMHHAVKSVDIARHLRHMDGKFRKPCNAVEYI